MIHVINKLMDSVSSTVESNAEVQRVLTPDLILFDGSTYSQCLLSSGEPDEDHLWLWKVWQVQVFVGGKSFLHTTRLDSIFIRNPEDPVSCSGSDVLMMVLVLRGWTTQGVLTLSTFLSLRMNGRVAFTPQKTQLASILDLPGPITVFAPTSSAFDAMTDGHLTYLSSTEVCLCFYLNEDTLWHNASPNRRAEGRQFDPQSSQKICMLKCPWARCWTPHRSTKCC